MGYAHPNLVPYQLLRAAGRSMVLAVGNDGQWRRAMQALGLSDMANDPELASNSGRLAARGRIVDVISRRVGEASAQHWIMSLNAENVPYGLVRTVWQALGDVTASARAGVPPLWAGTVRHEPPLLDEHGVTIRENGWSSFDVVPRLR